MTSYCLAIEVDSTQKTAGLGYMLAFRVPDERPLPHDAMQQFKNWMNDVKEAVLNAGDRPFDSDAYTRKVALAELMYDIEKINAAYGFKIGSFDGKPAVSIHSTDPADRRISVNFGAEDGQIDVREEASQRRQPARITSHGKTYLLDTGAAQFPFASLNTQRAQNRLVQQYRGPSAL